MRHKDQTFCTTTHIETVSPTQTSTKALERAGQMSVSVQSKRWQYVSVPYVLDARISAFFPGSRALSQSYGR